MFVRVKQSPGSPRQAVQLVESIRHGHTVRQKIIRHIGIARDDDELVRLKDLGEYIKAKLEAETQPQLFPPEQVAEQVIECRRRRDGEPLPVDLKQLRETARIITGVHDVYGALFHQLGLSQLLSARRYRVSHQVLYHCVMARLANPQSKRASVQALAENFGVRLPLQKVYRMMDRLDDRIIARLNALAGEQAKSLFGGTLRVVLFDCTTLYFESFCDDELKQPGYSKDGKHRECQVIVALAVTETGLPVHHLVLPGATFEGHSLIPVIKALQRRHQAKEVIVVADRGMMNEDHLIALREAEMSYIIGAKLKKLPKATQTVVLDRSRYRPLGDQGVVVQSVPHPKAPDDRLVISHCPVRARKDGRDRERAVAKLLKKLARSDRPKELLNARGDGRFLRLEGEATLSIDAARVAEAAKWDGLHGVITNLPESTQAATILRQYRGLWQVEETFRVSKHDLKVRPIYHWTARRIHAHIAIAFMSLMCVRHLQYRMALQQGQTVSAAVMANALTQVQHSVLEDQGSRRRYALPSTNSEVGRKLYRVMGVVHDLEPFELK